MTTKDTEPMKDPLFDHLLRHCFCSSVEHQDGCHLKAHNPEAVRAVWELLYELYQADDYEGITYTTLIWAMDKIEMEFPAIKEYALSEEWRKEG